MNPRVWAWFVFTLDAWNIHCNLNLSIHPHFLQINLLHLLYTFMALIKLRLCAKCEILKTHEIDKKIDWYSNYSLLSNEGTINRNKINTRTSPNGIKLKGTRRIFNQNIYRIKNLLKYHTNAKKSISIILIIFLWNFMIFLERCSWNAIMFIIPGSIPTFGWSKFHFIVNLFSYPILYDDDLIILI